MVDLLGRTVYDESLTFAQANFSKQFDLETLPQGMYMLFVYAGCQKIFEEICGV